MSDPRFDALVVGAGPAGSATAILLARAGWRVALVERVAFPRRKVCGECIAASNLPLLDALGVGERVAAEAGAELRRVALMRGSETIVAPLPAAEARRPVIRSAIDESRSLDAHGPLAPLATTQAYGRALGREKLDAWLVGAATDAGATLLQPWAVLDIAGAPGAFACTVEPIDRQRPPLVIDAALVVAAHGSWEPLRTERIARRATRRPSDLFAFKANFRATRLDPDLLPVLAFDGGYGGMVVADDGIATLACCIRDDRLAALRATGPGARAGDVVEAMLMRQVHGVGAALDGAVREGAWLASGPLRPGVRVGTRDGSFRVGNAAGEAHPIVGEGISMALQSAFVLADVIAGRRDALTSASTADAAQAGALAVYAARWRRRFGTRLAVAGAFAHAAMRPRASRALWPLVERMPTILTAGARWCAKTRAVPEARAASVRERR